jgi:hypothetical protein
MFTQLNPPIPLTVLDKGKGYAVGVIDYGQEHNLIWVTALSDSGEIWCAPNPQVRLQSNWTMGRKAEGKGDGCQPQPDHHVFG